jgi:hypothetical protein
MYGEDRQSVQESAGQPKKVDRTAGRSPPERYFRPAMTMRNEANPANALKIRHSGWQTVIAGNNWDSRTQTQV